MLLMDVNDTFDHVSLNFLLQIIKGMKANRDLMRWTKSFLSDRRVNLVIDIHKCQETVVDTGVPQG